MVTDQNSKLIEVEDKINKKILRMLNDKMLKPNNEACLKCKYQHKQIAISREKCDY